MPLKVPVFLPTEIFNSNLHSKTPLIFIPLNCALFAFYIHLLKLSNHRALSRPFSTLLTNSVKSENVRSGAIYVGNPKKKGVHAKKNVYDWIM